MNFHVIAAVFRRDFTEIALVLNKGRTGGKPGGWGLPGGRADVQSLSPKEFDRWERGELCPPWRQDKVDREIEKNASREVMEETGLKIKILDRLLEKKDEKGFGRVCFLAKALDNGQSGKIVIGETMGWSWFRLNDLPDGIYSSHRRIIEGDQLQYLIFCYEK